MLFDRLTSLAADRHDSAPANGLSRRIVLKAGVASGGGLMLGFGLPALLGDAIAAGSSSFAPNAFIRIGSDGSVCLMWRWARAPTLPYRCSLQKSWRWEAVETIRKARLHQKVVTTIFFESNGGQAKAEATLPEIRFAVAEPDLDIGNVETALEALSTTCYYLSAEKNRTVQLSPNLNKLLAVR